MTVIRHEVVRQLRQSLDHPVIWPRRVIALRPAGTRMRIRREMDVAVMYSTVEPTCAWQSRVCRSSWFQCWISRRYCTKHKKKFLVIFGVFFFFFLRGDSQRGEEEEEGDSREDFFFFLLLQNPNIPHLCSSSSSGQIPSSTTSLSKAASLPNMKKKKIYWAYLEMRLHLFFFFGSAAGGLRLVS